jgi:hypothetical protein
MKTLISIGHQSVKRNGIQTLFCPVSNEYDKMFGNCIKHMMRSQWIFWSFINMWYAINWRPMVILQNLAEDEELLRSVTLTQVMMA